ncbi:tyrosine-type recombinase/integrase [Rubellimicrobium mesophilum]|nr:tyrosine-type recombinase/integrase [Rubellimicrobium mesophilum]
MDRTIDFTRAVPAHMCAEDAAELKRRLKRLTILERFQTVRLQGRTMSPATSVAWVAKAKYLVKAARFSLENLAPEQRASKCPDGPTLFATLSAADFQKLKMANPAWAHASIGRFNAMFAEGYFDDWPASDVAPHQCKQRQGSRASDPFNDLAFTQILRAAFWLNGLQSEVLALFSELQAREASGLANNHVKSRRRTQAKDLIRSWTSESLRPEAPFPYHVLLAPGKGERLWYTSWPLENLRSAKAFLHLCQVANAVLILSSTGMRIGELCSLTANSLVERDGRLYIGGRSYKDNDVHSGQERDWPFPRVAVSGFEAQVSLHRLLDERSALWIPFGGEKNLSGLASLAHGLKRFGDLIALPDGRSLAELDGPITPHRFRYSVARYTALSLTGASQVLFDVLGHDDVEVTLGYAHRDPELHDDINKIRREVRALRVKEVFDHAEYNGGAAAEMVRNVSADMLARSGKVELETDDIGEAATILGEAELVKPGVLCTAQPLERGACSPIPGIRDVGACTSSCLHHLELAAHRQTRRGKLEYLLDLVGRAERGGRPFYQSQIVASLHAFPDLVEQYGSDVRLRMALSDCDSRAWNTLPSDFRERMRQSMEGSR